LPSSARLLDTPRFALLNCQSVNNKSVLINNLIDDNDLDALVLTETWHISNADLALRRSAPSCYSIVDAPRPGYAGFGPNYGGLAVVYRNCYSARVITISICPTSFEILVCHVNPVKLVLVTVYRPSSQNITETFFEEFTSLLEIVSMYGSEIVLTGDFNIHIDDATDVNARRFLDLLDAFDLHQHVTLSTHACGHTLDLLITRSTLVPTDVEVDVPILSDHGLVMYRLPLPKLAPIGRQFKTVRRLAAIDHNAFCNAVLQSAVGGTNDVADCSVVRLCEIYRTELQRIVDAMAPPINVVMPSRPSVPWYDGDCRAICRRVRVLERVYRRSHLPTDHLSWSSALQEKKTLFSAKEQHYWTTKLLGCAGNSKLLWRCLNSVLLRNNVTSASHSTLTAQALADFFVDKVARVRAATLHCPPATFTGPCPIQLNDFRPCTLAELRQIIMQSPCKSCHLDPLPHTLFMASLDQVLPFLHVLCNSSLTSGMLPDSEKLAVITPILKKSGLDLDSASSYRPVSNLSYVSKLIERLVCRQLLTHLHANQLLPPEQSAYRQHHSTETATLKIASDVFDAVDSGHITVLALLDLSAAFDTVDHDILLQRLSHTYGIGGTALRWVQSFLTGRTLVVNFADQQSTRSAPDLWGATRLCYWASAVQPVYRRCNSYCSFVCRACSLLC
jgi:hypothetical protein